MNYIDIHGHLNFTAYDSDREEVIERAEKASVAMINVGTQLNTSKKAVELAEKHSNMYAAIGLHPIHTAKSHHDLLELGEGGKEFTSRGEAPDMDAYRAFAVNSKVVAIGECGLDYYRPEEGSIAIQKKVFESMIDLAVEANKPLMLHLRNGSGRSAYHEAYDILKNENGITGNLHFFAGNIEETKLFLDLGFSFSFTGVITFARDYDEVIRYLPMDRIMSETDCPYVAPKPYRGKKNEPAYVLEVVKALAGIRGESEEMVTKQIIKNAERVFNVNCKNQNVK